MRACTRSISTARSSDKLTFPTPPTCATSTSTIKREEKEKPGHSGDGQEVDGIQELDGVQEVNGGPKPDAGQELDGEQEVDGAQGKEHSL
jgi:hypothetical protein